MNHKWSLFGFVCVSADGSCEEWGIFGVGVLHVQFMCKVAETKDQLKGMSNEIELAFDDIYG